MTPPRLVVHVGLPKTATTTMQTDFFPRLDPQAALYLGVFQPRNRVQDARYEAIRSVIQGEDSAVGRHALASALGPRQLVLSEELFTASSSQSIWRDRLALLADVVAGVDTAVVVTVREPAAAMASYYTEVGGLVGGRLVSFEEAVGMPDFDAYRFPSLFGELERLFGRERIVPVRFRDVVRGDLSALVGVVRGMPPLPIGVDPHNTTPSHGDPAARKAARLRLRHALERHRVGRPLTARLARLVGLAARWVPALGGPVRKPSSARVAAVRRNVAGDVDWLRARYGIDLSHAAG